ncbi:hypothetical protein ANN_16485 [Periplaneta americana]|uniref:Transposase n=1 Tax=Periplaneta americana TaxID=6978 RepID=A0ABQ8SJE6_PERAM|nr:hypothetical protein ANN_16485 [Periplaneta americana]
MAYSRAKLKVKMIVHLLALARSELEKHLTETGLYGLCCLFQQSVHGSVHVRFLYHLMRMRQLSICYGIETGLDAVGTLSRIVMYYTWLTGTFQNAAEGFLKDKLRLAKLKVELIVHLLLSARSELEKHQIETGLHGLCFILRRCINTSCYLVSEWNEGDNVGEMSPRFSTDSYPAFVHFGLRENPRKNLNQSLKGSEFQSLGRAIVKEDEYEEVRWDDGRTSAESEQRCGRPQTARSAAVVERVRNLVMADRRLTVQEIAEKVGVSKDSAHAILRDDLNMNRVAAKFVSKLLSLEQKNLRRDVAQDVLDTANTDPGFLNTVITGDESWVYGYDPGTKRQSSQWKHPESPRPKKTRQVRSKIKVMLTVFFDVRGIVHHEYAPEGQTVTKEYYHDVLRRLRDAVRRKRPDMWTANIWHLHHDNAPHIHPN